MSKLLFFAGSARKESMNKKLAAFAAEEARKMGAEVTVVDLKDYPMPLYCEDVEAAEGVPESAQKLKNIFRTHDGFFIASPEYNSSFSPLLKNTLDWISRPHEEGEAPLVAFKGKVAALGAVTPGMLGGVRGLIPLRMMLGNIGVVVIPTQVAVGAGAQAFNEDGSLSNERQAGFFKATIEEFVQTARAVSS